MGSECTICINFSKKFSRGSPPPNPNLRDGGIPLPHPPHAALRADLFTPPAVDPLDPPLFFEITGPSVFTNTSCLSFLPFWCFNSDSGFGIQPPPITCGAPKVQGRGYPPREEEEPYRVIALINSLNAPAVDPLSSATVLWNHWTIGFHKHVP